MLTHFRYDRFSKIVSKLIFCLAFETLALASMAQAPATQATVVMTFSPPYSIPLSEIYTSQQLNVIVTAINGPLPSGKISVTIQGNNGIRLANNFMTSPYTLDIAQGAPFPLSGGDLDEIFQPGNFTASGITVAQAFDEGLPPGSYDICFRVYVQGRVNWTPRSEERRVGEEQGWTRSREDKG